MRSAAKYKIAFKYGSSMDPFSSNQCCKTYIHHFTQILYTPCTPWTSWTPWTL